MLSSLDARHSDEISFKAKTGEGDGKDKAIVTDRIRELLVRCKAKSHHIYTIASNATFSSGGEHHLAVSGLRVLSVGVSKRKVCKTERDKVPVEIPPLTEDDDDEELARDLFHNICGSTEEASKSRELTGVLLSFDKLRDAIQRRESATERALMEAINDILVYKFKSDHKQGFQNDDTFSRNSSTTHNTNIIVSFSDFLEAFRAVPRVRGERLRWAGTLGIEAALAQLLRKGDAFDGLRGLRALSADEAQAHAQEVSARLSAALPGLLLAGLHKLRYTAANASDPSPHAQAWANAKFVADGQTLGRYATLDEFYRGPEELIGVPNPRLWDGMYKEHCSRDNANTPFKSTNYNIETWPHQEWEIVVCPDKDKDYPHTPKDRTKWPANCGWWGAHGRDVVGVDELMRQPKVQEATDLVGLLREELVGLRLYTGPMFVLYNAALRHLPRQYYEGLLGNRYETTIFVIASGITKLSKTTQLPSSRLLYRGLSGDLVLPDQFWNARAECTVKLTVQMGDEDAAVEAVRALASRVEVEHPAMPASVSTVGSLGALRGDRLLLPAVEHIVGPDADTVPLTGVPVPRAAAANLVEAIIVLPAQVHGNNVLLVVLLPGTRRTLEAGKLDRLVAAVQACCTVGGPGGAPKVRVEEVAEKPEGFRGGVELGLLSLSESRATALRYSGGAGGRLGTLLEVQVGRVDIGASISFLSQYPGEQEYLMPPMCCLEVVGEPRLGRTDKEEVVVVPMRINVNLKLTTAEDLIRRRKLLHAAATKNLREELVLSAEHQIEAFNRLIFQRRSGMLELLRGVRENVRQQTVTAEDGPGTDAILFVGRTWTTMWAPYLSVSTGRVYFEVEVVKAEGTLGAGFAGTRYSSPKMADVGDDNISWAIFSFDKARHDNRATKLDAVTGWFVPGAVLGIAIDVEAGQMMAAVWRPGQGVDETGAPLGYSKWELVYDCGVKPSWAAGGGLLPILTGGWGASGICNFGHKPMRHVPPQSDYSPLATAVNEERNAMSKDPAVIRRSKSSYIKEADEILDGLNVGRTAILRGFDIVKCRHENMAAEDYNDNSVYRDSLNDILTAKVSAERKQAIVVELLDAGAVPMQLKVVRDAPAADFYNIMPGALNTELEEVVGYSWRLMFSGWFRFLKTVTIPIETAPSLIALVFRAVFDAGPYIPDSSEGQKMIEDGSNSVRSIKLCNRRDSSWTMTMSSLLPVLRLQKSLLNSQRFENAVLGLVLVACDISNTASGGTSMFSTSQEQILTDADFRGLEYSKERVLQLAAAVVVGRMSGKLLIVNSLKVMQPATGQTLRDCVRRTDLKRAGTRSGSCLPERQQLGDRLEALDCIDWCYVMAEAALGNWNMLELSHQRLEDEAATDLAVGLSYVRSLTTLDLSHNCLQSSGAAALGSSLIALTALSKLELGSNSLEAHGATALGKHLPSLSHLRELGLANNKINAAGAASICQALSTAFTRLARLDLSSNALGQAGGDAVAVMLHSVPSLTAVGLGGQDVCSAVWRVLDGLVPRATSLIVDSGFVTMVCMPFTSSLIPNGMDGFTVPESTVELHRRHSLGPDGSRRLSEILKAGHCVSAARLIRLELSFNGILAEGAMALAPALAELSALTRLGLNSNNLGPAGAREICSGLCSLVNLESLSLEGNNIGAAGWAALAEAMNGLTALVSLNGYDGYGDLRAGSLTALEIPGKELAAAATCLLHRSATTLSVLDVSSNCLDSKSSSDFEAATAASEACRTIASFGAIPTLTSLLICDNALGKAGGEALSRALCCLDRLTALELARVELGPDGAAALSRGLGRLTTLRALGMFGNNIGAGSVAELCEALPNPGVLASLDIGGNDLGLAGATSLAEQLGIVLRLETLKAANNAFGADGSVALAGGLSRLDRLTFLDLRGNDLSPAGIAEVFQGLVASASAERASFSMPIRYLDLRENSLSEEGGATCAMGIACLPSLESLVLAGNALGLAGCREVLAALACRRNVLREIDLSENDLGPECGEDLGERLGGLCLLQSVYLEGNRLGPRGVVSAVDGLARLSGLHYLGLNYNELGPEGGTELGKILSRLTSLEVLELEGNSLGPEGGTAIAQGAASLLRLRELSLRDNVLGPDGSRKIAALLVSSEILKVDLLWNDMVRRGSFRGREAMEQKGLLATTVAASVMRDRRVSIVHRQAAVGAIRGSLYKLGLDKDPDDEAGWRERLCFVVGAKLLYESAKKKGEPELVTELVAIRSVHPIFEGGPPGFYLFQIDRTDKDGSDRASVFAANSAQERDRWIKALLRLRDVYRSSSSHEAHV